MRVDASMYARSNCSVSPAAAEAAGSFSGISVVFIQLARSKCRVFMASWLVREKQAPAVIVELLAKATRRPKTADWRPPLLVAKQPARATLRRALFALPA